MRTIITGAGGGIGLAVAHHLAREPGDQRILLVDRNRDRREANAHALKAAGAMVAVTGGEMDDPEIGKSLVEEAERTLGGVDALVVAAGSIANGAPMTELSTEQYEASFRVNTRPLFLLAQAAYPQLKMNRGAIVALSSTGARSPVPNLGAYSTSKAALVMLAKQLAIEWGADGIRVNCVSPGPTATPMAPAYADPDIRARRASTLPLQRICDAEDIAGAVAYLLSDSARNITGVDLEVDGGMALTTMWLSGAALGRET